MPSRLATLWAVISERMVFSPSLEATRSATSIPREPISRVMAITVMIVSYLLLVTRPLLSPLCRQLARNLCDPRHSGIGGTTLGIGCDAGDIADTTCGLAL